VELSEEAKQELRALGDLESRAIPVYSTEILEKLNKYSILGLFWGRRKYRAADMARACAKGSGRHRRCVIDSERRRMDRRFASSDCHVVETVRRLGKVAASNRMPIRATQRKINASKLPNHETRPGVKSQFNFAPRKGRRIRAVTKPGQVLEDYTQ